MALATLSAHLESCGEELSITLSRERGDYAHTHFPDAPSPALYSTGIVLYWQWSQEQGLSGSSAVPMSPLKHHGNFTLPNSGEREILPATDLSLYHSRRPTYDLLLQGALIKLPSGYTPG